VEIILTFWFHNYRWTWWKAKLEIQDAQRQPIMVINGPCCPCSCGSDVEFPVSSLDQLLLIVILTLRPLKSKFLFTFYQWWFEGLTKKNISNMTPVC